MPDLRVIEGGATDAEIAGRRRDALHAAACTAAKKMDDVAIALRVLGRHREADEITMLRDAWVRRAADAVEATR